MKKFLKWLGIIVGAIFLIIVISIISLVVGQNRYEKENNTTTKKELTQEQQDSLDIVILENRINYLKDYTWKANSLIAQYEANSVKADEMFKGKTIVITGVISDIGTDVLNRPYLMVGDYNYSSVQCVFIKSLTSEIAKLSKGQTVLLEGECKGSLGYVEMADCHFTRTINKLQKDVLKLKSK